MSRVDPPAPPPADPHARANDPSLSSDDEHSWFDSGDFAPLADGSGTASDKGTAGPASKSGQRAPAAGERATARGDREPESHADFDSQAPTDLPADPIQPAPDGATRGLLTPGLPSFVRLYRTFLSARAALAVALLAIELLGYAFSNQAGWLVVGISVAYAVEALLMWALPTPQAAAISSSRGKLSKSAWLATIGLDISTLAVLHVLSPPGGLNVPLLMAMPILMSGVMTPRRWALASAAAVTLVLLAVAWMGGGSGGDPAVLLTQAGLIGAGLFAIAVLAGELSARLATEQESARGSLEIARQQAQLNRLVIDEMQDGVLVVDRRGSVRAANPAARRLLVAEGRYDAAPFQLRGVRDWEPLVQAVEQGFAAGSWPDAGREVALPLASQRGVSLRQLRLRVRFTKRQDRQDPEDLCVLFIEDVRRVHARIRQEKLAAMGRMSAGIAHEIRNPLAAIAQANALLSEDATSAAQRQLTGMVSANVDRLKRIVDDVLDVAPGERPPPPQIDAPALVQAVCDEWQRSAGLAPALSGPAGALTVWIQPALDNTAAHAPARSVRFEPEHMRRILVNLLDNAWRHSTQTTGAVVVSLESVAPVYSADSPVLVLSVANDGDAIAAHIERSLFEPFFSTRSRGTGLGLYICRELCERYSASIDYRQQDQSVRHRNEFVITLPPALQAQAPSGAKPLAETASIPST